MKLQAGQAVKTWKKVRSIHPTRLVDTIYTPSRTSLHPLRYIFFTLVEDEWKESLATGTAACMNSDVLMHGTCISVAAFVLTAWARILRRVTTIPSLGSHWQEFKAWTRLRSLFSLFADLLHTLCHPFDIKYLPQRHVTHRWYNSPGSPLFNLFQLFSQGACGGSLRTTRLK